MKTIRNKIFETNSSSTHSFTIEKNNKSLKIDSEIKPDWDCEFGWEFETWNKPEEKLAYILRCLASYDYLYDANHNWENDEECINAKLEEILTPFQKRMKNLGINFEIPTNEDMEKGYVDHADWYKEEIEELIKNDDDLLNFLFNSNCKINGGNDNS